MSKHVFEWTTSMSVGISEFDTHHQRMFQLANKLGDSSAAGNDCAITGEILAELVNYTLYHFFAEEDVMSRNDFPGYLDHRKEHLHLTERTLNLFEAFHANKEDIRQEMLQFLISWVRNHIMITDKNYEPFLRAKGVH